MSKSTSKPTAPAVTPQRAARLYRLLSLTAEAARTRKALMTRLRVDLRGFYRDLELLRGLGIDVVVQGNKYSLQGELDSALTRLPFPDPGLSFRDALTLARGTTDAHRRLRGKLDTFIGANGTR